MAAAATSLASCLCTWFSVAFVAAASCSLAVASDFACAASVCACAATDSCCVSWSCRRDSDPCNAFSSRLRLPTIWLVYWLRASSNMADDEKYDVKLLWGVP